MFLTLIHHAYGAAIYDEPFRLHVAFIAIPVILILMLCFHIYQKQASPLSRNISIWVFTLITIVIPVGVIGLYEGTYNHLLKNVMYFGGASQAAINKFFPSPIYEMPNNYIFEVTGIFQFVLGVHLIWSMIKFGKETFRKKK